MDYLGINAYDRTLVKPYTTGETGMVANNTGDGFTKNATIIKNWFELDEDPNTKKNAWGCEIYPKSIYNLLLALNAEYPKTPIIITENGLGYYDDLVDGKVHDGYRIEFLNGFIDWMKKPWKKVATFVDILFGQRWIYIVGSTVIKRDMA